VYDVGGQLSPLDFFVSEWGTIFRGMLAMAQRAAEQRIPLAFDATSLMLVLGADASQVVLDRWRLLEDVRGASPANLPAYVAAIRLASAKVQAFRVARKLQESLAAADSVEGLAGRMSLAMSRLVERYGNPHVANLDAAADRVLNPAISRAIHCGAFPRFSLALEGFSPGDLAIVAARTKTGKSLLLLRMALSFAAAGIPALYIDTEMNEDIFAKRALAMLAEVAPRDLLKADNAGKVAAAREAWRRINPLISWQNASGWVGEQVVAAMHAFRRSLGPGRGVVLYDWLKMPAGDVSGNLSEWQALGYLVQRVKTTAADCGLPVVAATQQSKGAIGVRHEDQVAGVEAFMGASDRISQFASANCAIFAASRELIAAASAKWPGVLRVTHTLVIGGNRNGASGQVIPLVRGDDLRFVEVEDPEVLTFVEGFSSPASAKPKRKAFGVLPAVSLAS
jgi:replicative DNA helicase